MRKIKFHIDTGFSGCDHEDIVEYDDDITDKELEEDAKTFLHDMIEYWWEEIEEDEDEDI